MKGRRVVSNTETLISVENVSKDYQSTPKDQVQAVEGISFDVKKNEFLVIIGPSGCGKSTILSIMAGLTPATSGKVVMEGIQVTAPMPAKASVMFQLVPVLPWRTVLKNVEFGMEISGKPRQQRRETAIEEIKRVGLSGFENKYPRELSGGMLQRVALARVLAQKTDVILMDEPFGALDEQTRLSLSIELTRICQETRRTIVFVTHSLQEAAFLGDRIVVFTKRPGRVKSIVQVEIPRPRRFTQDSVNKLRETLWTLIAPEAQAMM